MAGFPKGIPYIIGNEAAERYSFYGMKAILFVFLTEFIRNARGELAVLDDTQADFWFHLFVFGAYGVSVLGAFLSDIAWGKYRTIMVLSIVYCIGHFVLALFETHTGFLMGCGLIAIGAGGIKPCVSAHVGDQFTRANAHLIERMYNYFYLAINVGAVVAYLSAEPLLRNEALIERGLNATLAFGLPGVLMVVATVVFWMGRNVFIAVPSAGWAVYKRELFSDRGWLLMKKLVPFYGFTIFFFACFDQTGSTWVALAQEDAMDMRVLGITFLPTQIGFINPVFILVFALVFPAALYPVLRRRFGIGAVGKVTLGFALTAFSFLIVALMQRSLDLGIEVSVLWLIGAFIVLTAGEMLVSVTVLEFSYTQAPKVMKSFIVSFYLVSVALGNAVVMAYSAWNRTGPNTTRLDDFESFVFFTVLVSAAGVGFYLVNRGYREEMIVQDGR